MTAPTLEERLRTRLVRAAYRRWTPGPGEDADEIRAHRTDWGWLDDLAGYPDEVVLSLRNVGQKALRELREGDWRMKETEAGFKDRILALARLRGWKVHHDLPSTNSRGRWRTAVQGDPGFPDLVMAHPDHGLAFIELKSDDGRLSAEQVEWLFLLEVARGIGECARVVVDTWRPSDWPAIVRYLEGEEWA